MLRIIPSIFLLVSCCFSYSVSAQDDASLYAEGVKYMNNEDFDKAIESFNYLSGYKDSNYRSVICALLSHKFRNTSIDKLMYFEGAPESGLMFNYWLGRVQLKRFKLEEAEVAFNKFLNDAHYSTDPDMERYKRDVDNKLMMIRNASAKTVIMPFESPINSRYADLPGALLGDGDRLVFMSDRNSEGSFEIFKADKGVNGWLHPELVSSTKIPSDYLNVLNVKESLFFLDPSNKHLCTVELTENGWNVNEDLDLPFLKSAHHIYVNKYRTHVIFSKKNENGDLDLFESLKFRSTGEWMEPTPISGLVNSPYIEDYPFLSNDRTRLYFSSNRPGGLGKCDIYYVEIDPETNMWGKPINAGIPVNSVDDDISFSMISEKKALISSNRIYSSGDLDLFEVEVKD